MELMRQVSDEDYRHALKSWTFVNLDGKTPIFASPFGDVFFEAVDGFWWLDIFGGALSRPWSTEEGIRSALHADEGQDHYLMAGLAVAAEQAGLVLLDGQILSFAVPPQLGGPIEVPNIEVRDFAEAVNMVGRIHAQTRNHVRGTRLPAFSLG